MRVGPQYFTSGWLRSVDYFGHTLVTSSSHAVNQSAGVSLRFFITNQSIYIVVHTVIVQDRYMNSALAVLSKTLAAVTKKYLTVQLKTASLQKNIGFF